MNRNEFLTKHGIEITTRKVGTFVGDKELPRGFIGATIEGKVTKDTRPYNVGWYERVAGGARLLQAKKDEWLHYKYEVTFKMGNASFSTSYSMGIGHCRVYNRVGGNLYSVKSAPPEPFDVLYSLQMDCSCVIDTDRDDREAMTNFFEEYGYTGDAKGVLRGIDAWDGCHDTLEGLRSLMGYRTLMDFMDVDWENDVEQGEGE